MNQIQIWFGITSQYPFRRSAFSSINALVQQIRNHINAWNARAKPAHSHTLISYATRGQGIRGRCPASRTCRCPIAPRAVERRSAVTGRLADPSEPAEDHLTGNQPLSALTGQDHSQHQRLH